MNDSSVPHKLCSACQRAFPDTPDYFYRAGRRQGLMSRCKACTTAYHAERKAAAGMKPRLRRTPMPLAEQAAGLPEGVKTCKACGEVKPATPEFFRQPNRAQGVLWLEPRCRACYYAARDERRRAANYRAYVERCVAAGATPAPTAQPGRIPNCGPTRTCIGCGQVYPNTPEHFPRLDIAHRGVTSRCRACYLLQARADASKRRARANKSATNYTAADVEKQYAQQKGKCYWCRTSLKGSKYHVDHIFALSRGGSNGPENICITCQHCNQTKATKDPHQFIGRLF